MAMNEDDGQLFDANRAHKISGVGSALKGKQFMDDEIEYYKGVKTKSKKNTHAEGKNSGFFT